MAEEKIKENIKSAAVQETKTDMAPDAVGRRFVSSKGGKRRRDDRPKDAFESKLLDLARVTRVAAGGKTFRFRATVVVGNLKGQVGIGVAKGEDVSQSIEKATREAKKNLILIPIEKGTIAHEVEAKFSSARVLLRPQSSGRGLVAGGTVRVICHLAGIKDISSKIIGRTGNKLNNARATVEALKKIKIKPASKTQNAA